MERGVRVPGVSPGGEEGGAGRASEESSCWGQGRGERKEAGGRTRAVPLNLPLTGLLASDTTPERAL